MGKMSISSLRNMSGSSFWSTLNMSTSSSSKDVLPLPLAWQLNTEERTSRRKKVAKTICKVCCKNIGFPPRQAMHIVLLYFSVLWMLKQKKHTAVSQAKTLRHFYDYEHLTKISKARRFAIFLCSLDVKTDETNYTKSSKDFASRL